MRRHFLPVALSACLLLPALAFAQLNTGVAGVRLQDLFPGAAFDPAVPAIEEVTGVRPGTRPLRPEEVVAYLSALAESSPRARLLEFGRTYEGRPLVVLVVSDEGTVADLDGFRRRHLELLDPRVDGVPAAGELTGTKAVAWLAYGIHGDELSSVDAAALVAYRLVAGTDEEAVRLRERLLVLIDPCENPDGRSRYLAQVFSFAHRTANPDPDDLSQAAVWPWGRGNHYLFDMNRDWFTMIQPEAARSREVTRWLPQLVVDSHEMGPQSTYLFSPPRHPFNPLLPANVRKWEEPFSVDQARALDRRGFPYFTGEWNEEFFPGYGSSWASYQGGVGILYEMSRTTGTLVRKREGTVRTFAQAIEHQTTSSLANLNTLAGHADEILHDQIEARDQAVRGGASGSPRAWVFPPDPRHPGRLERFAALLSDQGIEVMRLEGAGVKATGLVDARTGAEGNRELEAGCLLVRLDQPAGNLARVILDPHVPMDDVFFREEREYLEKRKGSRLYDTTAWSLILARGLEATWTRKLPRGDWRPWEPLLAVEGQPAIPEEFSSLILDGDPDTTPRVLADLLEAGVTVRVSRKPFTIEDRTYGRGALVLRREGNVEDLREIVDPIAVRHRVRFQAVETADAATGPDLGGAEYPVLIAPHVAVLTGMPVSPSDYGFVWHLLDQELDLRFSGIDAGRFARVDLSRYNVLVFPPVRGGVGMYKQVLGSRGLDNLRTWIEAGGTAIGLGGGARFLADPEVDLAAARFRDRARETYPSPVWSIPAREAEAAGPMSGTGLRVPGEKEEATAKSGRKSPYDVAPVLGPGARPFAAGFEQGTPLETRPLAMAEWVKPVLPPGRKEPDKDDLAAADGRLQRFMPQGVLLRTELDDEFWLDFGLPAEITVWFGSDDSIVGRFPVRVAARFGPIGRLHLGGLLWPEAAARLAGTAYATREARGRGQIILFADQPAYRRWMVETERMLLNAILLGPGLGTRWSAPW